MGSVWSDISCFDASLALSLYLSHQTPSVRVGPTPMLRPGLTGPVRAATAATASESSEPPGQGTAYPGFLTRAPGLARHGPNPEHPSHNRPVCPVHSPRPARRRGCPTRAGRAGRSEHYQGRDFEGSRNFGANGCAPCQRSLNTAHFEHRIRHSRIDRCPNYTFILLWSSAASRRRCVPAGGRRHRPKVPLGPSHAPESEESPAFSGGVRIRLGPLDATRPITTAFLLAAWQRLPPVHVLIFRCSAASACGACPGPPAARLLAVPGPRI